MKPVAKSQHSMKCVLRRTLDLQVTAVRWERRSEIFRGCYASERAPLGAASRGRGKRGDPLFSGEVPTCLLPLDTVVPLCIAFTLMWKPRKRGQLYYPRGICTFSSSHFPFPLLLSQVSIKLSSRTQLKGLLLQDDFPDSPTSKS